MGVTMDNYNVTSKTNEEYFDFDGDIEKGEVSVKLEEGLELEPEANKMDELGNGNLSISTVGSSNDDYPENVRLIVVDKKVVKELRDGGTERKVVKEKPLAMSAKKPPKPPRPPRGLSLDSADQKLIRELQELARLKRGRVERMKALKKGKEAKTTSSRNQLLATLLTVLFCLVLFLPGISSRTSSASRIQQTPFSSDVAKQHN